MNPNGRLSLATVLVATIATSACAPGPQSNQDNQKQEELREVFKTDLEEALKSASGDDRAALLRLGVEKGVLDSEEAFGAATLCPDYEMIRNNLDKMALKLSAEARQRLYSAVSSQCEEQAVQTLPYNGGPDHAGLLDLAAGYATQAGQNNKSKELTERVIAKLIASKDDEASMYHFKLLMKYENAATNLGRKEDAKKLAERALVVAKIAKLGYDSIANAALAAGQTETANYNRRMQSLVDQAVQVR